MVNNGGKLSVVALLCVVLLFAGCIGGGGSNTPSYTLQVTVLESGSDSPIPGAQVEITGARTESKSTSSHGVASFTSLTGDVDILVEADGYLDGTNSVTMNTNRNITIRLISEQAAAVVTTETELQDALDDPEVEVIILGADLTADLDITRLVGIVLEGHTVTGNITYDCLDAGEIVLSGEGMIDGNLTISAPNATVTNRIVVSQQIVIDSVAANTWNEESDGNSLVIDATEITINIIGETLQITINGADNVVNITGAVDHFVANASVEVTGADKIELAEVNSGGVVFDVNPGETDGDFFPVVLRPFVPGSGGILPEYSVSSNPPQKFGGLYVTRSYRELSYGMSTRAAVDFWFVTPDTLGSAGFGLEFSDDDGQSWQAYETSSGPVVTINEYQDNFALNPNGNYLYRLKAIGGELDGYTSNEVEAPLSNIDTRFSSWGWQTNQGFASLVGWVVEAYTNAETIGDGDDVTEHLSFQWYRVDPITYEMEEVPGATETSYITSEADAGYELRVIASGDGENVDGFVQQSAGIVRIPNKAFMSDVTSSGFVLNLYKEVGSLDADELVLFYNTADDSGYLEITDVTPIGSMAEFQVSVEIPDDTEYIFLNSEALNWTITRAYSFGHMSEGIEFYF